MKPHLISQQRDVHWRNGMFYNSSNENRIIFELNGALRYMNEAASL